MNHIVTLSILAVANHIIVFGFIQLYKSRKVRRIYNLQASQEQLRDELSNSYFTSPIDAVLIGAALYSGFLKDLDTTWLNFTYTFAIVFVWTKYGITFLIV